MFIYRLIFKAAMVTLLLAAWLLTLGAVGVSAHFTDGSCLSLRGWWWN